MKKIMIAFAAVGCLLSFSVAQAADFDAANTYKAMCQGCHGADGSRAPMNGIAPFKGKSAADLQTMLEGYQNNTYGGASKHVMTGILGRFSPEQLKALADYSAGL